MADYTAIVEAGNALADLLRDRLTPEPVDDRESIALCSPHESGNYRLTLYLYHVEEENPSATAGWYQADRDTQRPRPARYALRYLVTAHSKAPAPLKEADQHRILGAVLQILRDEPVIPARFLSGSLAEEGAELHVMIEKTSTEHLLKIWNDTTKEYRLSVVVLVTGVTIRSRRERRVSRVTEVEIGTAQRGTGGGR